MRRWPVLLCLVCLVSSFRRLRSRGLSASIALSSTNLVIRYASPPEPMYLLSVQWIGAILYQLLGTGLITRSIDGVYPWELNAHVGHIAHPSFFGGNCSCTFHAWFESLDTQAHGPFTMTCVGEGVVPYRPSSCDDPLACTLTYVPNCVSASASLQMDRQHLPLIGESIVEYVSMSADVDQLLAPTPT